LYTNSLVRRKVVSLCSREPARRKKTPISNRGEGRDSGILIKPSKGKDPLEWRDQENAEKNSPAFSHKKKDRF